MTNHAEAYDDLFEDISSSAGVIDDFAYEAGYAYDSAVPAESPQERPEREPRELPRRREREKPKAKPRHNAAAVIKYLAVIGLLTGISIAALHVEVQLAEINEKISDTKTELEEAESLEVQLTMQAAQRMTDAQVEQYATEQLGMGKMSSSQVVYLHVAQQDRGTVVQETTGGAWYERVWAAIRGWFA